MATKTRASIVLIETHLITIPIHRKQREREWNNLGKRDDEYKNQGNQNDSRQQTKPHRLPELGPKAIGDRHPGPVYGAALGKARRRAALDWSRDSSQALMVFALRTATSSGCGGP